MADLESAINLLIACLWTEYPEPPPTRTVLKIHKKTLRHRIVCVQIQTCTGVSGLETGAKVQMTLSLERGLEVKKEQGRTT